MTALLTDNLPLLAGAPNGIKKLRELILELAVRGKLVPQDPNDEPASELLKRIAEEKARLVAEGKIRTQKPLKGIDEEDKPFNVPSSWEWTRLGELGLVGSSSRVHQKDWQTSGVPFYRAREIVRLSKDGFVENELFISEELYQELSTGESVPKPGDIMLTGVGTIGVPYCVQKTDRFYFKDASVLIFKNHVADNSSYLLKYFISPLWVNTIHAESMGTTVHTLTIARANQTLCPLPPLAEQHRIVAKVDELMALCDRLEAQQADAESAHAQLVQALLNSLTQVSDATEFAANWQRLAEHFHTLFITESSIDALKQTLLQLAVMGKLVPQDPSDEPASELLKRIVDEKARLVAVGKIRKQTPMAEICDTEKAFELPTGWAWQRFANVALDISTGPFGSLIHQSDYVHGGVPLINPSHMIDGGIVADQSVSLSPEMAATLDPYRLNSGDMVMARRGEVGRVALVTDAEDGWLCGTGSFVLRFTQEVSRAYIWSLFRCNSIRTYLAGAAVGTTMVNLNHGILLKMPTAVPPLAEQHRIVDKVDQLMTFCDQLKTRLTQARQLNEQLANTLVAQALVEDKTQEKPDATHKAARSLLAAEITHQLHSHRTFGQRKLQKVIYLAEHAAKLTAIQGQYLRDAAGPHDRQLMSQVESSLQEQQWYERIYRDTVGHAYKPLSAAGQHRERYQSCWATDEREKIQKVITLMRDWTTDRCEMTVTLYAAWNDLILDGLPVTDDAILGEVLHSWSHTKLRFKKSEWLAVLTSMKKIEGLTPSGFGSRTIGGALSLPGFEQTPETAS